MQISRLGMWYFISDSLKLQITFNSQIMQALLSPQCGSAKPELFTKCRSPSLRNQRSPSCRNKRIPSLQEHLCHSNHILRSSKQESPSKGSEEFKRKKSQLNENNQLNGSSTKKKLQANGNPNTQNIINSIQDLKEEYQILKQAYKELIQQKIKNQEEMVKTKLENQLLKSRLQQQPKRQHAFQAEIAQLQQSLRKADQELQEERKKNRDLVTDIYFIKEKEKGKTDDLLLHRSNAFEFQAFASERFKQNDKEGYQCADKQIGQLESNIAGDSHLLSFSLTSVIDDSIKLEQFSCRRKEHVKVVSDLSQGTAMHEQFRNVDVKGKKVSFTSFKKNKKEPKLDLVNESKAMAPSPVSQLLNLKSPASSDKKNLKIIAHNSTTKRRKEDKQNIDLAKNSKKKSKKLLQITGQE